MKINCLACGHNVVLDDVYDDYEGQVKCFGCGALLEIETDGGNLKKVKFLQIARPSLEEELERIM